MKAFLVTEKYTVPNVHLDKTLVIISDKAGYGEVAAAVDRGSEVSHIVSRRTNIVDIQLLEMNEIIVVPEKKE
jgi:hypothetical protein